MKKKNFATFFWDTLKSSYKDSLHTWVLMLPLIDMDCAILKKLKNNIRYRLLRPQKNTKIAILAY